MSLEEVLLAVGGLERAGEAFKESAPERRRNHMLLVTMPLEEALLAVGGIGRAAEVLKSDASFRLQRNDIPGANAAEQSQRELEQVVEWLKVAVERAAALS